MSASSINGFYPTLMPSGSSNIWEIISKASPAKYRRDTKYQSITNRSIQSNSLPFFYFSAKILYCHLQNKQYPLKIITEETQSSTPSLKGTRVALSQRFFNQP